MAVSGMLRSVGRSFTGQQAGTGDCPGLGRPDQIYSCNRIKKSDFIFSYFFERHRQQIFTEDWTAFSNYPQHCAGKSIATEIAPAPTC